MYLHSIFSEFHRKLTPRSKNMPRTPQTESPPLGTSEKSGKYTFYKWLTFILMYMGYTLTVLNRKSFSFALPAIMEEHDLDKDDLGKLST